MVILGNLSIRQVIDDDLAIVSMPSHRLLDPANDIVEAPHDPRFAMAHQMEQFRQRAAQSYLDIFRAFCQNRCRVRRTLCHSIQDWETVQMDAEEIDQLLQVQLEEKPIIYKTTLMGPEGTPSEPAYSLPLSSWAYLYKLRLMEWIVQLGFELETYQPTEMAGMYWYLAYLAKIRAAHLERIKSFTIKRLNELRAAAAATSTSSSGSFTSSNVSSNNSSGHHLSTHVEAQFDRSLSYLRVATLDAAVTWELAEGLSCLYTVLYRLKLLVPPPRPYSTDALRYDIRMKPFAPIGLPELPSYEIFNEQVTRPEKSTDTVLDAARKAVAGAKTGYEVLSKYGERDAFAVGCLERWTAGMKGGLKSAIAAGIAVAAVKKAVVAAAADNEEGGKLDLTTRLQVDVPKPEKGYHEWWIVPRIGERKKNI